MPHETSIRFSEHATCDKLLSYISAGEIYFFSHMLNAADQSLSKYWFLWIPVKYGDHFFKGWFIYIEAPLLDVNMLC